jgi:hypothetical protein
MFPSSYSFVGSKMVRRAGVVVTKNRGSALLYGIDGLKIKSDDA